MFHYYQTRKMLSELPEKERDEFISEILCIAKDAGDVRARMSERLGWDLDSALSYCLEDEEALEHLAFHYGLIEGMEL